MKIIGIVGSSQVASLPKDIPYLASDGGYLHLMNHGIDPLLVIGDFDSLDLSIVNHPIMQLPTMKNETDTEIAIQYAIENGYQNIRLYGVTGERLDHFFAVIGLLLKYSDQNIVIIDDLNEISLLNPGSYQIKKEHFDYCSFYPINECHLTLKDFKYPLSSYLLNQFDPLATSNEWLDKQAFVETDGQLLIVRSKKR